MTVFAFFQIALPITAGLGIYIGWALAESKIRKLEKELQENPHDEHTPAIAAERMRTYIGDRTRE